MTFLFLSSPSNYFSITFVCGNGRQFVKATGLTQCFNLRSNNGNVVSVSLLIHDALEHFAVQPKTGNWKYHFQFKIREAHCVRMRHSKREKCEHYSDNAKHEIVYNEQNFKLFCVSNLFSLQRVRSCTVTSWNECLTRSKKAQKKTNGMKRSRENNNKMENRFKFVSHFHHSSWPFSLNSAETWKIAKLPNKCERKCSKKENSLYLVRNYFFSYLASVSQNAVVFSIENGIRNLITNV